MCLEGFICLPEKLNIFPGATSTIEAVREGKRVISKYRKFFLGSEWRYHHGQA